MVFGFKTVGPGGLVPLISLATMALGLLLQIAGVATMGWMVLDKEILGIKLSLTVGLFMKSFGDSTESLPTEGTCGAGASQIRTTQATSIMAILISAVYIAFMVLDKMRGMVPIPAVGGALVGFLFLFTLTTWGIMLVRFFTDACSDGGSANDAGASMGFSFYLYVLGSFMSIGGCAFHLVKRSIGSAEANSFGPDTNHQRFDGESPAGYLLQKDQLQQGN